MLVGLSSYKLVQFKEYVNPEGIEIPIVICLHIAQTWLGKLGFVYKKVCKDVFIDRHKQLGVIEDQNLFLTRIEELKSYMIKYDENSTMKAKKYPVVYVVGVVNANQLMKSLMMSILFLQMIKFEKYGLEKEIHFYDQKNKLKRL